MNFIVRYDTGMRGLTLILSDLHLPAESVREALPDTLSLPSLEWLLRFSKARHVGDWRHWLAREMGASVLVNASPASALAARIGAPTDGAWFATPVSLEARLDHVRLRDRGLLRVPAGPRQKIRDEFARSFGPEMSLHEVGERGFLLVGGPQSQAITMDPARYLDSDIGPALPAAGAAGGLRRLAAEIEMWLHSLPLNDDRERSGQRRITSLWLWGGGSSAGFDVAGWRGVNGLRGGDPWLRALAGEHPLSEPPASFHEVSADDRVVEFAPMSGAPGESLGSLEKNWFAPLRAALSSGKLDTLTLVANDKSFTTHARAGWRFWRSRRGWLAALAKA
jgi:hypothetical protein